MATVIRSSEKRVAQGARQLSVRSRVMHLGGEWRPIVGFQLTAEKRRVGGAEDWVVSQLGPAEAYGAQGTVFDHVLHREPLLCLAARGAWSLWNDNVPFVDFVACKRLAIEVSSDVAAVALILVCASEQGTHYSGWSCQEDMSLSMETFDTVRRRDVGHWIRLTLNEVAFGNVSPLPQRHRRDGIGRLPTFWTSGRFGSQPRGTTPGSLLGGSQ